MGMITYAIKRLYASERGFDVILSGLTIEEAKEHCRSPESSSRTASSREGKARTRRVGAWFDGFEEEA